MVESKQKTVKITSQNITVCSNCGKFLQQGYELRNYNNKKDEIFKSLHFCSINCLARWVGEQGWFHELILRGINSPEELDKDIQI
jgi:hypothetical protein